MRRWLSLTAVLTLLAALAVPAGANDAPDRLDRPVPDSIESLRLDSPIVTDASAFTLDASLATAEGDQTVIIRLVGDSLAESGKTNANAQAKHVRDVNKAQDAFVRRMARDYGAREIARVQRVLNAVFVEVDAAHLGAIAADSSVVRVAAVANYEMDLSETVPYIGGSTVQADGVDGSGIKVAVLDSGIDYTHIAFGGEGTLEAYADAYGESNDDPRNTTRDGLFPTEKVVDGYDFVGESWPNGDLAFDPDPIDFEGHGSHVADIIGGENGVAPGVDLYAVKVCSAVSSSCSGIALILGVEFAVDPNFDGKLRDRVDIMNMSLGSVYGQPFDDDLSFAVENASTVGVLTVASAGNSADKPYITGTPSATPAALSVAQTQVPSASLPFLTVNGSDYQSVFQPWSTPPVGVVSGPLQYADGAGGNLNGCAPFAPGSLNGLAVLVDRGACNFTLKIKNIGDAGGVIGIIGLIAPGAPFPGGDGGDSPITIPGYMVSQADSNALKAQVGSTLTVDPANALPLVGQMVGSSSRGPSNYYQQIKPEIGAPGASVSAEVGTGTGTTPFGGTSGAAPMVSGAAALILDGTGGTKTTAKGKANGQAIGLGLSPVEVKALLMNNGETDIATDPFSGLAPITRIGGGEVRVDRALDAPVAAWDDATAQGALSFGMVEVPSDMSITKTVRIRNYDNTRRTYSITPTFRFDDDALSGAISVSAPDSVTVKPGLGRDTLFDVTLSIDASELPGNFMNSGSQGGNPLALTANEFDGYLVLDDGDHPIHLAWHILPRQAAQVVPDTTTLVGGGFSESVGLENFGAGVAQNDAYSLVAVSPDLPEGPQGGQSPTPDLRAFAVNTFPVPAGFCSDDPSFIWAFALNTWEEQSHLVPVSHIVELDTDRDGTFDYAVLNRDLAAEPPGFNQIGDGRQVTWALGETSASAFFFAEHATNTGNTVLLICGEQVGLSGTDMLTTSVDVQVTTQDFYYGGPQDVSDVYTITPLGEQYVGLPSDLGPGEAGSLDVLNFGAFPGNSPELGVLLITNGDRG
ncbi:MAG: S8 family serine peptidase, partial [Acidimicrobiia bacterium]|nr:S8 family serine peptidase [Acidimicrobiia bacterium]